MLLLFSRAFYSLPRLVKTNNLLLLGWVHLMPELFPYMLVCIAEHVEARLEDLCQLLVVLKGVPGEHCVLPHVSYGEKHCDFFLFGNALLGLILVLGIHGFLLICNLILWMRMIPVSNISTICLHVFLIDVIVMLFLLV